MICSIFQTKPLAHTPQIIAQFSSLNLFAPSNMSEVAASLEQLQARKVRGYFCFMNIYLITVMCLSIGTPKIINFPFVPNGKLIIFRCPKIKAHYSLIMMCLNIGAPKIH